MVAASGRETDTGSQTSATRCELEPECAKLVSEKTAQPKGAAKEEDQAVSLSDVPVRAKASLEAKAEADKVAAAKIAALEAEAAVEKAKANEASAKALAADDKAAAEKLRAEGEARAAAAEAEAEARLKAREAAAAKAGLEAKIGTEEAAAAKAKAEARAQAEEDADERVKAAKAAALAEKAAAEKALAASSAADMGSETIAKNADEMIVKAEVQAKANSKGAETGSAPTQVLHKCSMCGDDKDKSGYSSSQWKKNRKNGKAKCLVCVAAAES